MILEKIRSFGQSSYLRNILILLTGSGIRQFLPLLLSPVLTRLFSPSDFAILGVYLSCTYILCSFNTGKFELAILLPKSNKNALIIANVARFISIISFFLILIIGLILYVLTDLEYGGINVLYLAAILSFTSLFRGEFNISSYQLIREKKFFHISKNKVVISLMLSALSLFFGFLKWNKSGLILSEIIANSVGTFLLFWFLFKKKLILFEIPSKINIIKVFKRYGNFPKFTVISDLFTMCSIHFPLLFLTKYFDEKDAGYYSMIYRVLSVPISLIAFSILDVFKEEASKSWREKGNFWPIYKRTLKLVFFLAIPPFTIIFVGGPKIFEFIFGEGWGRSGEFAQILVPMFFIRFVALPLSYSMHILQKQKELLTWSVLIFLFTSGSLILGRLVDGIIENTLFIFCLCYSFIFAAYFLRTLWLVRKHR